MRKFRVLRNEADRARTLFLGEPISIVFDVVARTSRSPQLKTYHEVGAVNLMEIAGCRNDGEWRLLFSVTEDSAF